MNKDDNLYNALDKDTRQNAEDTNNKSLQYRDQCKELLIVISEKIDISKICDRQKKEKKTRVK